WLSGSGPFSINYSTFDYAGAALTSTLLTLNNVTGSNVTLSGVVYKNSRLSGQNYNYTIFGSSTGLNWTHVAEVGLLAGDSYERNDTANLIHWQNSLAAPAGLTG